MVQRPHVVNLVSVGHTYVVCELNVESVVMELREVVGTEYEVGVLRAHLNRHFLSADTCIVQNFIWFDLVTYIIFVVQFDC